MLRVANRDFERSLQRGNVLVSGGHRELWSFRKVATLNQRLKGLVQDIRAPRGPGRLYAVTVVLAPLDHCNNVESRAKPKQKRYERGKNKDDCPARTYCCGERGCTG